MKLLGLVMGADGNVGLPISVINIGTSPCAKQPVCCTGNTVRYLLSMFLAWDNADW